MGKITILQSSIPAPPSLPAINQAEDNHWRELAFQFSKEKTFSEDKTSPLLGREH